MPFILFLFDFFKVFLLKNKIKYAIHWIYSFLQILQISEPFFEKSFFFIQTPLWYEVSNYLYYIRYNLLVFNNLFFLVFSYLGMVSSQFYLLVNGGLNKHWNQALNYPPPLHIPDTSPLPSLHSSPPIPSLPTSL